MALIEALSKLSVQYPDRVAVFSDDTPVTFAELDGQVRRAAAWLHLQGLRAGDVVGLTLRDEHAHLVFSLASMRLGCSQVTLASYEPAAMRSALAGRCGVACVIVTQADQGLEGMGSLVTEPGMVFADSALDRLLLPQQEADPVVFMASSGTTGRSKLVPSTQRQIFGYGIPRLPEPSVLYRPVSIESNIGKWSHLTNLARGRTLVFCSPEKRPLADICRRFGVTMVNMNAIKAATLLQSLEADQGRPAFEGIRFVLGGSPVSGRLRAAIQKELSSQLYVMYGATECGIVASAGPEVHAAHPDAVGHPLPGVEIGVVGDAGKPLPPGEVGYVRIRSLASAVSYFGDEDASAKAFRDGWFHPGDLGSMTRDGMLIFHGRSDDMMILNTINIFPAEIESVAESFPGVLACAAFPLRSRAYGDIPMLAVVPGEGFDPQALQAHCRERLGTRSPRKIVQVDHIPRNAMGKVLRRELATLGGAS